MPTLSIPQLDYDHNYNEVGLILQYNTKELITLKNSSSTDIGQVSFQLIISSVSSMTQQAKPVYETAGA
jgi:hypothetical protein